MKQLLQRYDDGELRIAEVPVPSVSGVQLLVEARASLISPGTERATVELGRASLLEKARRRPDQLRQVIDKVRTDGLASTVDAVRAKLQEPTTLGYCSAGVLVAAGPQARGFALGDRVVTNGAHGEYVRVPHTLAARVPDGVDFGAAAFTPLGAIALQGIRLAAPTLGETVVVYGLGLIGLLAVQLLRANGCRVIGIDRDAGRLALGERFGAAPIDGGAGDSPARVLAATGEIGADAVLLTLAASSDEPVHEAAAMSRQRGRLVLVGVTGLALRREDFYHKELSFSVSCSYGPGRYDPSYEDEGHDYPVGFVRWTEQRNFEAVLQLMAAGALVTEPLISHRFRFDDAPAAYELLSGPEPSLGVLLEYADRGARPPRAAERTVAIADAAEAARGPATARDSPVGARQAPAPAARPGRRGVAAVIGTGAFARRTLLPALRDAGFVLHTAVSGRGTGAAVAAEKFGFRNASTDVAAALADPAIDTVFVLTRHDSHARFALLALAAGKHVFVEKPLALAAADVDALEDAVRSGAGLLSVGFNRRFAPFSRRMIEATRGRAGPLAIVITVNAGSVPRDHWTRHPEQGGGRIAGEACHFIDLARALVGAPIVAGHCVVARDRAGGPVEDLAHLTLGFADGSTAAIHYLASGARAFPKERVEAFVDGRTLVIENWRRFRSYGGPPGLGGLARRQDKGHAAEIRAWYAAVTGGGPAPIPLGELLEVSRWTLRLAEQARSAAPGPSRRSR